MREERKSGCRFSLPCSSKDSLHLQKVKKETRLKALDDARREASQLGNFVRLVDQVVTAHFVDIVLENLRFYVADMLSGGPADPKGRSRLAGFEIDLVFEEDNRLGVAPSLSQVHAAILSAVEKIPGLLTKGSVSLSGRVHASYLPKGAESGEHTRRHEKSSGEKKKTLLSAEEMMRNVGVKELTEPTSPRESEARSAEEFCRKLPRALFPQKSQPRTKTTSVWPRQNSYRRCPPFRTSCALSERASWASSIR